MNTQPPAHDDRALTARSLAIAPRRLGRYLVHKQLASGGMASVYLGRLIGPAGFSRAVAIKRLHPHLAHDPQFVGMLLDEARIAARVRHPNVVPTVDVVSERGELFVVMEYVHGEPLGRILRRLAELGDGRVPHPIASAIAAGMLAGLHAAHEATSEDLQPLGVVHRDVSPPNVILGADGVPRTVDFGIAMALGRLEVTKEGQLKGKLPYMAPEQIRGQPVDRRVDVWATTVVLWEMLAGRRLFDGDEASSVLKIIGYVYESPIAKSSTPNPALDAVLQRGLAIDPRDRFPSAMAMLSALEAACPPASAHSLARWLEELMGQSLGKQRVMLLELETTQDTALPLSTRVLPDPTTKPRRRPWLWVALAAAVLGGLGAFALRSSFVADAKEATRATATAEPSPKDEPALSASAAPSQQPTAEPAAASSPAVVTEPSANKKSTQSTDPRRNRVGEPSNPYRPPTFPTSNPAIPGGGGI